MLGKLFKPFAKKLSKLTRKHVQLLTIFSLFLILTITLILVFTLGYKSEPKNKNDIPSTTNKTISNFQEINPSETNIIFDNNENNNENNNGNDDKIFYIPLLTKPITQNL